MKKIEIKTEVFDINYSFYFFVKELNSTNGLTKTETKRILGIFNTYKSKDYKTTLLLVQELFEGVLNHDRRELLLELIARIDSKTQYDLFEFSVRLIFMKPLLLEESKFISDLKFQNIENFSPLSLSYDSHSKR